MSHKRKRTIVYQEDIPCAGGTQVVYARYTTVCLRVGTL